MTGRRGGFVLQQSGRREPGPTDGRGLVVFLSGTWMSPASWTPWRELFDRNGYDSRAGAVAALVDRDGNDPAPPAPSLGMVVRAAAAMLSEAQRPAVVIGHGIGALAAQSLLNRSGCTAAAIAIAPPPAGWVSRTAVVTLARSRAALGVRPRTATGSLRPAAFARAYASTVGDREAAALHRRYVTAGATAPLLTASLRWRDPTRPVGGAGPEDRDGTPHRPPLLVLSGGRDRLCPERTALCWTRFGRRHFPDDVTDHHVFVDRGHSLTIDSGWPEVANFCLDWLTGHDL